MIEAARASVSASRAGRAAQRQGQADDDVGDLILAGEDSERLDGAVARHAAQGHGEMALGVGDGDADAAFADVEAEGGPSHPRSNAAATVAATFRSPPRAPCRSAVAS